MSHAPAPLLRKILFALIAVPLFAVICGLCVMNADTVSFLWWPVASPLDVPLFVVILAAFATGFLAGGVLTSLDKK